MWSMNQGKLEVVKQEMPRVKVDILPEPQHQAPPLGDALIEGPEDYHHL